VQGPQERLVPREVAVVRELQDVGHRFPIPADRRPGLGRGVQRLLPLRSRDGVIEAHGAPLDAVGSLNLPRVGAHHLVTTQVRSASTSYQLPWKVHSGMEPDEARMPPQES